MISIFCINYFSILAVRNEKKKQRLAAFTYHAYLSAEIRLISFLMQMQKKRKSACNPIISVFLLHVQIRVIGKSCLKHKKQTIFLNSESSYDFRILFVLINFLYLPYAREKNNDFEATYDFHILYFPYLPFATEN